MALLRHDSAPDLAPRALLPASRLLTDAPFRMRVDPAHRAWLLHEGSLTERMRRTHGLVRVTPTLEGIGAPHAAEATLLDAPERGGWWIREITLAAGDVPRLRARTLVPPAAPRLQQRLRGLGATPLGRVLFDRDRLRREVVRGRRWFGRSGDGAWLRLSRYRVRSESLLVIERLLPAAFTALPDAPHHSGR